MDRVPFEIAEGPRRWCCERRRIQEDEPAILDERIDTRNDVRPTRAARRTAARHIDHRRQTCTRVVEHLPRSIHKDDVGTRDEHGNRDTTAAVEDAANLPATRPCTLAGHRV